MGCYDICQCVTVCVAGQMTSHMSHGHSLTLNKCENLMINTQSAAHVEKTRDATGRKQ